MASGGAPGPITDSLIKYDTPVFAGGAPPPRKKTVGAAAGAASPMMATKSGTMGRGAKLPPVEAKPQVLQSEEILNQIIPPHEWSQEGSTWVQKASSAPATRLDVITLQDQLDTKLKERQARETGICPIRQELYAQTFGSLLFASHLPS